ncbi:MAG: hypothetical protein NVSMB70_01650 [Chamaesiphon sp.]
MDFKPLLASPVDLPLRFPLLASPKLDGIRAVVRDGVVYSRSHEPIPNAYVQRLFGRCEYFDGELIVGDPTAKDVFNKSTSGVMSRDGEPDVTFWVFDHVQYPHSGYCTRMKKLPGILPTGVRLVPQEIINDKDELDAYEEYCVTEGYEGVMLRDPAGRYKMGRSTAREGILLKLKRFEDAEFPVVGYTERMHNGNEAKISELGYAKRSSHKENKVGRGDLGALILHYGPGAQFQCGTGFDDAQRGALWQARDQLIGKVAKVKYLAVGMKDVPRHPVFLGFRDPSDTS